MTISITVTPEYAIPGKQVSVAFAATEPTANYVRISCTAAPEGSQLRERLDDTTGDQVVDVHEGSLSQTWQFSPDAGGAYAFSALEIAKGATDYGGGYDGDEAGYRTEELLSSNAVVVYVAGRLEASVGVGSDKARLVCFVANETIATTTEDAHGETTPAIVSPTSSKAQSAAQAPDVTTAIEALQDYSTASAIGDPEALGSSLIADYELHRASASYHTLADTNNVVPTSFHNPQSPSGLALALNELRKHLDRHLRNDSGTAGTGTAGYHQVSGEFRADLGVSVLAPPASQDSRLSQLVLIADLSRVIESHKLSGVHATVDSSGSTALPRLLELHREFMVELAKPEPSAPPGENPGTTSMIHSGGFEKS